MVAAPLGFICLETKTFEVSRLAGQNAPTDLGRGRRLSQTRKVIGQRCIGARIGTPGPQRRLVFRLKLVRIQRVRSAGPRFD